MALEDHTMMETIGIAAAEFAAKYGVRKFMDQHRRDQISYGIGPVRRRP